MIDSTDSPHRLAVGIDFGTSGCRACVIDESGTVVAELAHPLQAPQRNGLAVEQAPAIWAAALERLLADLLPRIPAQAVGAIAVDGTSGTVLLADKTGQPLGNGLMYNDGRALAEARRIAALAPRESAAHGTASSLSKLLWLLEQPNARDAARVLTQADFLNCQLAGRYTASDENNTLKLGYDPLQHCWPGWLQAAGVEQRLLPEVVRPGTPLGTLAPRWCERLGLPADTLVAAGTTDATAAIIATGVSQPGEAVTSLGSTLVVKVLSERPVFAPEYGVYSQPFGGLWLVGGGSNSGGAVLRHYFSDADMAAMTPQLRPHEATGLDYYPLLATGERFPVNDPQLAPRLTPRPDDTVRFFQAMLEGMARIEQRGYRLLAELGAPYPSSVRSVGGGARNAQWTAMRGQLLGVPMLAPAQTEAAYGSALLARRALHSSHRIG